MKAIAQCQKIVASLFLLVICVVAPTLSFADINDLKVVALSPQDSRAVVQSVDNQMQVVAPGNELEKSKVLQILSDKLVLKNNQGEIIWIFLSVDNQPSEVKVLRTIIPESELSGG